jgi:F-type H+-transporting ATPase subunit beta
MIKTMPEAVHAREEQAPVGTITEVHGPVVVIACDRLPPLRQALSAYIPSLGHRG